MLSKGALLLFLDWVEEKRVHIEEKSWGIQAGTLYNWEERGEAEKERADACQRRWSPHWYFEGGARLQDQVAAERY